MEPKPTDQIGRARLALLKARDSSPTGELPEGALTEILKEYFGRTTPLEAAAELGLIHFSGVRGELTPGSDFTAVFKPYPPHA